MECRVGREAPSLWDEQVRLIRARSPETAYAKAKKVGKENEITFANSAGEKVRWRFAGIGELVDLLDEDIESGIEVFSRLTLEGKPRVPAKSKLIVFWSARNQHKTAGELLAKAEPLKKFAPHSLRRPTKRGT